MESDLAQLASGVKDVVKDIRDLEQELERQFVYVREIAHILHTQASGEEVRKILIGHIDKVEQASIGKCEAYRCFMGHVSDVTARFWKGLVGCYDHPDLPSNNNALEGLFGSVKQQQRRVHGRKSTAGGPLDGCAEVLLEVWSRLDDYPDLLAIVRDLPEEKVKQVREKIDELAGPSRIRRSIARDPDRYLSNALAMLAKK